MKIVGVSGSLSNPSRTTTLVELIVGKAAEHGAASQEIIHIAELAADLGSAINPKALPDKIRTAYESLYSADVIVVGTPVYKASYTGLLKHFFDLIDPKDLKGKIAVLAATGGSDHHALVVESQLRPLLSFFGVYTVPTGLYARDVDFDKAADGKSYSLNDPALLERIDAIGEQVGWLNGGRRAALSIAA